MKERTEIEKVEEKVIKKKKKNRNPVIKNYDKGNPKMYHLVVGLFLQLS